MKNNYKIKGVKNIRYNYLAFKYLIKEEIKRLLYYRSNINIWRGIWCLFHGFSSEKYELYDFKNNDYKLFLSDFKRYKTSMINGEYSLILNDKAVFSRIFEGENITARSYGKIYNGKIILNDKVISIDEFLSFLKNKKRLIIKKHNGGGGKGIHRLTFDNNGIRLNDQLISGEDLYIFINKLSNFLIVEHLSQADYSDKIYSPTINTIRIITMINPETNEVFIPIAVHKFGSSKTHPADNVWSGGMTALVDIETGVLKKSALHHHNNKKIERKELHPDTNVRVEGTVIPHWQLVKEKVIEIAESFNFLNYVGWDVVVTNDGIKIIEGNNFSDVNILQIHQPLLLDKRVRDFYEYYKII